MSAPPRYTVDDWLKLPDFEERIELIDGSFVVSPAAMGLHALCAGSLRTILAAAAKAAGSDLVVVEAANVAEVVSPGPGNRRRDYEVKPVRRDLRSGGPSRRLTCSRGASSRGRRISRVV